MDRYKFCVGIDGGFFVTDEQTGQKVASGTLSDVRDFLDHQENVSRIEKQKELKAERRSKRRGFFKIFAA